MLICAIKKVHERQASDSRLIKEKYKKIEFFSINMIYKCFDLLRCIIITRCKQIMFNTF